MAKAKKGKDPGDHDSKVAAAKRVQTVYKLIRSRLGDGSWYSPDQKAQVLNTGKAFREAQVKLEEANEKVDTEVLALQNRLEDEYGIKALRDARDKAADAIKKEWDRLYAKFEKIAVRVESGRDPEKVIDALLALAEEVGVIDPLPPDTPPVASGQELLVNALVETEPHLGSPDDQPTPQ